MSKTTKRDAQPPNTAASVAKLDRLFAPAPKFMPAHAIQDAISRRTAELKALKAELRRAEDTMTTTTKQTRRQIIHALRTRHHVAYMVSTGAPMDSIVCRKCHDAGWADNGTRVEPLTHSDICAIGHEEKWEGVFVCEACETDLLA
jgi:hypothetical protein